MSALKEKILKDIQTQIDSGVDRETAINEVLSHEYKVFEEELTDFKQKLGLEPSKTE